MWIKSANHLCMFSEESKIVRDKYDGRIDHQGWVTAQHSRLNHPQMGMCSCFGDMCSLLIWVRCLPYIGKHTGWWFGPFFIFPYTGNNNPISEGLKPPTRDAFQIDENHPWRNLIQQKLVNWPPQPNYRWECGGLMSLIQISLVYIFVYIEQIKFKYIDSWDAKRC